jgi:hypothetical protein
MTNSLEALKPISIPKRAIRDWNESVMRHCDHCSGYELTVQDNEGAAICAECCDAEHIGNLESALDEAIKRNAELIAALEQTQTERDDLKALNQHLDLSIRREVMGVLASSSSSDWCTAVQNIGAGFNETIDFPSAVESTAG